MKDNERSTITFELHRKKANVIKETMTTVYEALVEKGYDQPIDQIVGYILSEDPTYITSHNKARTLISKIDRDELLRQLLINYLGK
ncbi:MAG: IreB family regulatory phosphoprotein [Ruminococcaceae bacterium]|nr:IreB family regulatory phosphoprotein [Oscillospiraceae bacterium]